MADTGTLQAIALHSFVHVPNVGDRVNPLIVEALSGRNTCHAANLQAGPHLMAVGSIASRSTPGTVIWGTGVMAPEIGIGTPVKRNVLALRGQRSHRVFRDAGIAIGDIPLGDPAVLSARLLGIRPDDAPPCPVGVVAHYAERHLPSIRRLLREEGVADLDVHVEPRLFLTRMARCRVILSTSLHGLIFAESLGLPNLWIKASDLLGGGAFKFEDWFSTTRRPQRHPHRLTERDTVRELAARAELHELAVDQEALIAAFPGDRADILRPLPRGFLPVAECRTRPMPVFLVATNPGPALPAAIAALHRQTIPVDVVVHDSGSTDPLTQAILADLEKAGTLVVRCRDAGGEPLRTDVDATIGGYFAAWGEPRSFAVGRDIAAVSMLPPRALELCDELLRRFPIFFAGPAGDRESGTEMPLEGFGRVRLAPAVDDFSFAVYRAGDRFTGGKSGMRAAGPCSAGG